MPAWPVTLLALAAIPAFARDRVPVLTGVEICRVVAIPDGDRLRVRCGAAQLDVHVAGIDAPQRGQPRADRARRRLAKLCLGELAAVWPTAVDRLGRTEAHVRCNGADAGATMVRDGYARSSGERPRGNAVLPRLKAQARAARRGLWSDLKPVPPWEWRARQRPVLAPRERRRL